MGDVSHPSGFCNALSLSNTWMASDVVPLRKIIVHPRGDSPKKKSFDQQPHRFCHEA